MDHILYFRESWSCNKNVIRRSPVKIPLKPGNWDCMWSPMKGRPNDLMPLDYTPTQTYINCNSFFFVINHTERHYWIWMLGVGGGGAYRHCCVPSTCNAYPLLYRLVYDKVHRTSRRINSPFAPWPALLDVTSDKSATETSNSKSPPFTTVTTSTPKTMTSNRANFLG